MEISLIVGGILGVAAISGMTIVAVHILKFTSRVMGVAKEQQQVHNVRVDEETNEKISSLVLDEPNPNVVTRGVGEPVDWRN